MDFISQDHQYQYNNVENSCLLRDYPTKNNFPIGDFNNCSQKSSNGSITRLNSAVNTPLDKIFRHFPLIITESSVMAKVLNDAINYASSNCTILIQGESGTGKDLLASAIHRLSPRSDKRLVTINCCAISQSLLESELFGHVKGSFTGADRNKQGYFTKAHRSTLFLDEIGDMPANLQAKLLRVLQNQVFHPVGSSESISTDVRIIAATNIDLRQSIAKKTFRLDLYYRLNVLPLHLPPLRERINDIPLLIEHFIEAENNLSSSRCSITNNCLDYLKHYYWPGNIRECRNLISRLVITKRLGTIDINDLPSKYLDSDWDSVCSKSKASYHLNSKQHIDYHHNHHDFDDNYREKPSSLEDLAMQVTLPAKGINLVEEMKKLEIGIINKALKICGDNKNKAANLLGMKRTTLVEKLKRTKALYN